MDSDFVKQLDEISKNHKYIVLTAQPGMGKSILWQHLAFETQKNYKDKTIYLIYLKHLRGEIPEIKNMEDISKFNVFEHELSKENTDLLIGDDETQIILYLDAFDYGNIAERKC